MKDLSVDVSISHRSTALGLREDLCMSWSNASRVTDLAVMLSRPLTPVDAGASGSPTSILD